MLVAFRGLPKFVKGREKLIDSQLNLVVWSRQKISLAQKTII